MGYALPSDRYFCVANHKCVFLDLVKDRYFCLPEDLEADFQTLSGVESSNVGSDAIERLIDLGVIVRSKVHDLSSTRFDTLERTSSRFDIDLPQSNPWLVARAVYSQRRATRDLAIQTLQYVLSGIAAAKIRHKPNRPSSLIPNHYLAAYRSATRLLSAQDQCLRTAVAFTRLLNRDGYFPDLVIGVRMSPFRAHAWVQDQGALLTDSLDTVLPFTPILVI
jgi:hypothetical protein